MNESTKPKANAKLHGLPPEQRAALEQWLFEDNLSYAEAQGRLRERYGVECAESTVHRWYKRREQRRLLAGLDESSACARQVAGVARRRRGKTYRALVGLISQEAFAEAKQDESMDVAKVADLTELVFKAKQLELRERKLMMKEHWHRKERAVEREKAKPPWYADPNAKMPPELIAEVEKELRRM